MIRLYAIAAVVVAMLVAAAPGPASAEGREFVEQKWGALAAALWRDRNGTARVASGASWGQPSENEAINVALNSCRNQGGQDCKIIGNTFTGCGYIAIGNTRASVRYGTGETPQAAADQCRIGGFRCTNPVGGCSN
jgi:Domain of unknown function (DUF4189)